jgi:DNA-3-methyladenine glycosylase II
MAYTEHLLRDKRLRPLISSQDEIVLKGKKDLCHYLCASIMSQQLSTKVAAVIHQRFLDLFGGIAPSPEQILTIPPDTLRGIGLSNAKAQYVRNVAQFALEKGMSPKQLNRMTDEGIIEYLTQIKGVGKWTAEMLLMFALKREDVFPADDLGIQQAMIRLYALDSSDKKILKQEMHRIAAKWSPYRTYASMHLWNWKDGK